MGDSQSQQRGLTWRQSRDLPLWPLASSAAPPHRVYWVIEQRTLDVCSVEVACVVVNDPVAGHYDFSIVVDEPRPPFLSVNHNLAYSGHLILA